MAPKHRISRVTEEHGKRLNTLKATQTNIREALKGKKTPTQHTGRLPTSAEATQLRNRTPATTYTVQSATTPYVRPFESRLSTERETNAIIRALHWIKCYNKTGKYIE